MAYETVIVGVDPGGAEHRDAIAFGAVLARVASVPLLLVSVYEPRSELTRQAHTCERGLDAAIYGSGAVLAGLDVHRLATPSASAAEAMHMLADQRNALAVVIGSSPRANWGQVALGEVGQRLVHGGRSPVVVVPRGYASRAEDLDPIGVGYAGTPESEDALRFGAMIATKAGASLQVITAFEPTDYAHAMSGGTADGRKRAEHDLSHAVASIHDTAAIGRLIDADPADALTRESGSLGLLILGSRSYGPLRAVLVGRVSGQLLLHAVCPVMVVPHTPDLSHEVALLGGLEATAGC